MSTSSPSEDERRLPAERSHTKPQPLVAEVVAADAQGSECTIYPAHAEGLDLMTRWITASDGSFVGLDQVR